MPETKIYIENLSQVQKDFQRQGKSFDQDIKVALVDIGKILKSVQVATLIEKVVKWTGQLAKSIKYEVGKNSVTVGGSVTVRYTDWVESGGRGGFMGYWYMKSSLTKSKGYIIKRLHKTMGVHAKYGN